MQDNSIKVIKSKVNVPGCDDSGLRRCEEALTLTPKYPRIGPETSNYTGVIVSAFNRERAC